MASFAPIRGTRTQILNTPVVDGQFLIETDQGIENKIYLDDGDSRISVGGTGYFTYSDNGILGAKNFAYSQENNTVIADIKNGISYKVSWVGSATVTLKKNDASGATIVSGSTSPLEFTADADYDLYFGSDANVTNIMVRLASDNDDTFQPYSKTNQELTEATKDIENCYSTEDEIATNNTTSTPIYLFNGRNCYIYDTNTETFCKMPLGGEPMQNSGVYANDVWTNGKDIYCSQAFGQYVLNGTTWEKITWNGFSNLNSGWDVWTDGTNIYYSSLGNQYKLNGTTWETMTWSGLTSFYGSYIWTDGTNIYYSYEGNQYKLNGTTWETMTWGGLTSFDGVNIWTDGTDIYYSANTEQYKLNGTTWETTSWTISDLSDLYGVNIWTDGTHVYLSVDTHQYKLNGTTWETWSINVNLLGSYIWTGNTINNKPLLKNNDYIPFYDDTNNNKKNIKWSDFSSNINISHLIINVPTIVSLDEIEVIDTNGVSYNVELTKQTPAYFVYECYVNNLGSYIVQVEASDFFSTIIDVNHAGEYTITLDTVGNPNSIGYWRVNGTTDSWTSIRYQENNTVTFEGLDGNYGYQLYVVESGSGTGYLTPIRYTQLEKTTSYSGTIMTLVYTIIGGTSGTTKYALRVIK